ncbi:DNA glycosylase/AP lyase ROS1 [Ziziphus jujuba]|uniref:DNA glycosylase/AP lyase ROS1 n=4 Tax=Ziziphus jujuba TaxID=326968 RepID=A0A6P6GMJ5_ZIZJJ|nr:DNA glycosylase/AP lyase ROS1 [Ziziphus jujuba]XP_024935322.3 DNA glycosylase/AP lyase ROS1 [Ziziphus jujuba]XP_024935323.3 DNA glycosylase/AP lyase ROS1 [Ziziphus jujuba]
MDMEQPRKNKSEMESSWIPMTPLKPFPQIPEPICSNGPRLQTQEEIATLSEKGEHFHSQNPTVYNTNVNNWGTGNNVEICREISFDGMTRMSFTGLLALANAATVTLGNNTAQMANDGAAETRRLFSSANSQIESHETQSLKSHDIPLEPQFSFGHQHSYDLNLPPGTTYGGGISNSIPQFAPVTPDKPKRADNKQASEPVAERGDQGREKQQNEAASTMVDIIVIDSDKEIPKPASDSFLAAVSTPLKENNGIDLNKTPQKKQRRKKHRPKVVREGKPKRTPKPVTPKPAGSKENPTEKRKYVRKKGVNKAPETSPPAVAGQTSDFRTDQTTKKSCRRTLNFETEEPKEVNSSNKSPSLDSESYVHQFSSNGVQSKSTVPFGNGLEVTVGNTQAGIACDLSCSTHQMLKSFMSFSTKTDSTQAKLNVDFRKEDADVQVTDHTQQENTVEVMLDCGTQSHPRSSNDSNCSTTINLREEKEKANRAKRKYYLAVKQADTSSRNLAGVHYNTLQAYQMSWMHFPNIYKKKRSEKGQIYSTSSITCCITATKDRENSQKDAEANPNKSETRYQTSGPHCDSNKVSAAFGESREGLQDKLHTLECIVALSQKERTTKKRSRGAKRVRDLASLSMKADHSDEQRAGNVHRPHTCIDTLVSDVCSTLTRKKGSKKRNSLAVQNLAFYGDQQSFSKSSGTPIETTMKPLTIGAIIEQLKCLDINRESSEFAYQEQNTVTPCTAKNEEQNALVLYRRDGPLVSFDPTKKRRPRPKVDLDEETNRVWKLLLENINSEGIDGTDEDKVKWWEEERRVFRGRADSFIARMHLVQGDRRFSQWKGSVVDSVVGVFLTQNVSDHLSSSAFMSLAAHFPVKPRNNDKACVAVDQDEPVEFINEIPNLQDTEHNEVKGANSIEYFGSNKGAFSSTNESECKLSNSSASVLEVYHNQSVKTSTNQIFRTVAECYMGRDAAKNDAVSPQNSVDSSISQTSDKGGFCSESNSETEDLPNKSKHERLDNSISFMELLRNAESTMLHEVYVHAGYEYHQPKGIKHENQKQSKDKDGLQTSLEASTNASSNYCLPLTTNSGVSAVDCFEIFEETQSSNVYKNKDETSMSGQSTLTVESASPNDINKPTMHAQEAPICSGESFKNTQGDNTITAQTESRHEEITDITLNNAEQDSNEHGHSSSKEFTEMNALTSKSKNKRVQKEKKNEINWDKLREKAESNGRRERTPNTMDSLDWEAVRCADVHEIADTIKERGMNNMLGQRIKDFLNRLVREHGSIDLEWLRNVPPDQAKEYLLSIRGLGLKSVECVRLLTLHHLAFPVDTNVGRIAVRLGWVPLQPLPESLQLHLLELYPVLESIQKYLWPRLCKLDQRTLYELHYQMITFGKVFCTKSKPNCNACPMRGECRHFASAFASARLALPGPEEKSIISATEKGSHVNPTVNNGTSLPLLQENNQLEENQQLDACQKVQVIAGNRNCEPIIEEPATPEPECTQMSEDIEDAFYEDPDAIPTIKLNIEEFTQNLQNYMQENMELQEGDMSKALVALTTEAASIPMPKLKNVSRLRTEHLVYELPDSHPLLEMLKMEKRELDDPSSYLLAIWTPGETVNSIQPPEKTCCSQDFGRLCNEKECFSCNSVREANSQTVRGTLLIPCRTAMRGSFPLNGTYFQVNEVFADHASSLNPIDVPRAWIWNLHRRTVYFGTSIPTIFKGLSTQGIQHCFWKGFVCVRGFDQKTRAPRPLIARLHFPASKLTRNKERKDE